MPAAGPDETLTAVSLKLVVCGVASTPWKALGVRVRVRRYG